MPEPLKLVRPDRGDASRQPALKAEGLSQVFRGDKGFTAVFENLDFQIERGELVCILGPSGCGKTTLLNVIAGFVQPSGGTIEIEGHTVRDAGPDRCVVFQEDALFPWLTVAENIAFGAKQKMPRAQLKRAVDRYLQMVGLSSFANYLPREISGGMNQRVALARVLILNPRVLLMDEPFGALDAQTREEMQKLLLSIWETLSQTIVFVTHDLNEAVCLADRILLMGRHPGRIEAEIPVPLPRPRKQESNVFHRFYRDLRRRLTKI